MRRKIALGSIITICVLLNLIAWKSTAFSDFFVCNIFPVITYPYAYLTSLFPFSVGEVLLILITCFVVFAVLFVIAHTILMIYGRTRDSLGKRYFSLSKAFERISEILYKVAPVLMAIVVTVMTLNCFILYHTSKISLFGASSSEEGEIQQLAELRDFVVKRCNELSQQVPHDEDGNVIYEGDMGKAAIVAMRSLESLYPRLGGYYVTPKALHFSDFMSQQYMQGYYFPFSMEANYNDTMSIMNKPFTMCHELAHTHGYIYEDEANFLAFMACINSDDIVFQYSGYLGVLNYINNDYYEAVSLDEYNSHVKISARVKYDNQFMTDEAWQKVEEKAVVKTETVKKAAETFIDTNLKVNGVASGKCSYTHVVALIMDYYYNFPSSL